MTLSTIDIIQIGAELGAAIKREFESDAERRAAFANMREKGMLREGGTQKESKDSLFKKYQQESEAARKEYYYSERFYFKDAPDGFLITSNGLLFEKEGNKLFPLKREGKKIQRGEMVKKPPKNETFRKVKKETIEKVDDARNAWLNHPDNFFRGIE